jgi:hypothetical protein
MRTHGIITTCIFVIVGSLPAAAQSWLFPSKLGELKSLEPAIHGSPILVQATQSDARCKRAGSVRIVINGLTLGVPRIILSSVTIPGRGVVLSLECETRFVRTASGVFLNVSRTRAGNSFYENWITTRRLPPHISIRAAGYIRTDYQNQFEGLLKRGFRIQRDENGIEFIDAGSRLFALSSSKEANSSSNKLYVNCSHEKLVPGGHLCTILYKYGVLDLRYRFSDAHFPKSDWLTLDERLRAFIQSMMNKS